MPAEQQQVAQEPMTAARTSSEQPRPVEPMSVDSPTLRGGDGDKEVTQHHPRSAHADFCSH
ncbi:hypothetical protein ESCO_001251 [Escovopsis weberi]|uniref:Uncharacterized protein n=1 Tax=Escovopsis weberi TaxID=150374 RepID=A0A0M8N457_ESCWE|nr:hypothetical protein ESCO_001251 [Escovopsis weberi]